MSFSDRHNKKTFNTPFDTTDFDFKKCRELEDGKVYRVYGYFSSVGMYGKQYSLILRDCFLNLPKYMTDELDGFTKEDDDEIEAGKVGVVKRPYTSKTGKKCFSIVWSDIKD